MDTSPRDAPPELRDQADQRRGGNTQSTAQRLVVDNVDETAQDAEPRPVGLCAGLGRAPSRQHQRGVARGGRAAGQLLGRPRLADPRLAGQQHDPATAPRHLLEGFAEPRQHLGAPHEVAALRPRLRGFARRLGGPLLHRRDEAEAAATERVDEALLRARVPERPPNLEDRNRERVVRHRDLGPDALEELRLGDDALAVADQMPEHRKGLRLQRHQGACPAQLSSRLVELELAERVDHRPRGIADAVPAAHQSPDRDFREEAVHPARASHRRTGGSRVAMGGVCWPDELCRPAGASPWSPAAWNRALLPRGSWHAFRHSNPRRTRRRRGRCLGQRTRLLPDAGCDEDFDHAFDGPEALDELSGAAKLVRRVVDENDQRIIA